MAKKRITQRDRVLQYIKENGSITAYDAFKQIGCTQVATRIKELKGMGYKFRKERVYKKNQYGDPTHYDKYFLVENNNA